MRELAEIEMRCQETENYQTGFDSAEVRNSPSGVF